MAHHARPVYPPKKVLTSTADLDRLAIPNMYRDKCVDIAIPLIKCRRANGPVLWECVAERHEYDRCAYELNVERRAEMEAKKAAKAKEAKAQQQ